MKMVSIINKGYYIRHLTKFSNILLSISKSGAASPTKEPAGHASPIIENMFGASTVVPATVVNKEAAIVPVIQ
jgi:hypothetical protein